MAKELNLGRLRSIVRWRAWTRDHQKMNLTPPPLSHTAFNDSPLFSFSTIKDTPPTHGAENNNVEKWIKKSLINSTFQNRLTSKFKDVQKGPKCNSFWQNLCHSKGQPLLSILSLIFFRWAFFGGQSWVGECRFDHTRFVSVCMFQVYLPQGIRKKSSPLSNLVMTSPSPANKTDTIKTKYCECKHRWSETNQPKNLSPPSPSQEKIHHISINENIIFWRWKETDQFEIL